MPVERNNPMRGVIRLRDTMDKLLEESFTQPLRGALESIDGAAHSPFPVDVVDAGDRFVVHAALPGVMPEDVHVQVQGDVLTVKGAVKAHGEQKQARWLVREMRNGEFVRQIRLPAEVVADRADAQLEHGMLTLTLPKVVEAGPKRIKIGPRQERTEAPNPSVADPTKPEVAPAVMGAERSGMAKEADTPAKDMVTVESEGSFPASDPPSWTPERS